MPAVVSMPPNINTAAFDTASSVVRPWARTTSVRSESVPIVLATLSDSAANAVAPAAVAGLPAVTSDTDSTIEAYQASTVAASESARPSASASTATASGPAKSARRSALPVRRSASSRRVVSAFTNPSNRSRTAAGRNGGTNGSRWRACSGPSSDSMLGPTTRAVEKRGSSTVNVAASRMTCCARV